MARREHTRAELLDKLQGRGGVVLAGLLDELAAQGLQSDARFTESYVGRRAERGYGPVRISQELERRGIEQSLIARAIASKAPEWDEHATQARVKRFGPELPRAPRERARQSRFLHYRGFTDEQIRRSLSNADP